MELGFCPCAACFEELVNALAAYSMIYGYTPVPDDPKFVEWHEGLPKRVEDFFAKLPPALRAELEAMTRQTDGEELSPPNE